MAGPSIAAGEEILAYLDEVVDEYDLDQYIRYRHRVTAASWSTEDRRWTVEVTRGDTGQQLRLTAGFLWMCQGYYNHTKPYRPRWEGLDRFQGVVVHPQRWPEDLDLAGKRVVVIGSGATAATLIPAIADKAEHVTMLQRSPSYFYAPPTTHELAVTLRALDIPEEWTHEILRRQYISQYDWLARTSLEAPDELHTFLIESMRPLLPEGFDVDKHFTPRYRPWQQRIAVVPDGDLFAALREGNASMVTDTIEAFTEHGIKVSSGEEIPADIVVTATGFNLSVLGDVAFTVDGEPVDFAERVTWRGIMINGLPNMRAAVSALDALCADLGVDPSQPGLQTFEATDMLVRRRRIDPCMHLVVWQVGLIGELGYRRQGYLNSGFSILLDYLEEVYGAGHTVVNYVASRYPGIEPLADSRPLAAFRDPDAQAKVTGISTFYLPPKEAAPADEEMLTRLGLLPPGATVRATTSPLREIDRYGPRELKAFDAFARFRVPAGYHWQEDTAAAVSPLHVEGARAHGRTAAVIFEPPEDARPSAGHALGQLLPQRRPGHQADRSGKPLDAVHRRRRHGHTVAGELLRPR